ncbi:hypothetical protein L5515_010868 [Caenorhabditis briggsae]|uniref:Uncharacterized protein n=1 Tax=Caenorhabditis briggsae TaxID=6238 RepID=A0AAE9ES83_CAEBR|nr:hypothetical protein L5515_010868 [Caenorhabditis briggsae]
MAKEQAADETAKSCPSKTDTIDWHKKYDKLKREKELLEIELGEIRMDKLELELEIRPIHPRVTAPPEDAGNPSEQVAPQFTPSRAIGSRITEPNSHGSSLNRGRVMISGRWPKRSRLFPSGCRLCSGSHAAVCCTRYPTQKDRINRYQELRMCSNCLRQGNAAQQCKAKNCCQRCRLRHHVSVCESGKGEKPEKEEKPTFKPHFNFLDPLSLDPLSVIYLVSIFPGLVIFAVPKFAHLLETVIPVYLSVSINQKAQCHSQN